MNATTYDVTVFKTSPVAGSNGKAYRVRWRVATNRKSETFHTSKLAESFRAGLLTAARKGEAFDLDTGLPVSMRPRREGPTWLDFAMEFIDVKWPHASPLHRQSTADGLVTITVAMANDGQPPAPEGVRKALRTWAFSTPARVKSPDPPLELAASIAWIAERSRPVGDLADPVIVRQVLDAIGRKLNGEAAAPATVNRKRAALSSAVGYALECGHLDANPLHRVRVKRRQLANELDSRTVVNHAQARALLEAVRADTPALEAFLGCIYYAAMRPGEVRNLRRADLVLADSGWGEAVLSGSYQDPGKDWTDDGKLGEERGLKHRAERDTRAVPLAPPLVHLLRRHLDEYGTGPGGWLFVTRFGPLGRPLPRSMARPVNPAAVTRALKLAREKAFTAAEQRSPLARRPYDLRHAAVSTWLAAGVPPTQVAAWAGHSVAVLLKVYAHVIDGQAEAAMRRIEIALTYNDPGTAQAQTPVDD
ncbi:MAG: tyrosine-type recombinase/integrase [Nocardioides sp.]